jgi:co-chaperonin GroES (HSP10)
MNLRPLRNRVLIQPAEAPTHTASGLHLAEHWKPEQMGTVIAVGPVRCDHCQGTRAPVVAPGDLVLFSWSAGQEVFDHDADSRYLMLNEADVIAVIER